MIEQEWKKIWKDVNIPLKNTTIYFVIFDLLLVSLSWVLRNIPNLGCVILAYPLLALAMAHLYLILHEATHKLVSRTKWINDLVGHFCGWFVALPFLPRQRNHLGHHVWAGHPTHDPENSKLIKKFSVITDKEASKIDRLWKSWLPFIAFNHIMDTWKDPFIKIKSGETKNISRYRSEIMWARIYWACYFALLLVLIFTGSLLTFLTWFIPCWISFLMFLELANLPHHAETPLLKEEESALPVWQQGDVSHNCDTVPFWSRWIMLNFNLHIIHHQFPNIPWYNLPQAQKTVHVNTFNQNELGWALTNRKRSLIEIMGHYFDKRK